MGDDYEAKLDGQTNPYTGTDDWGDYTDIKIHHIPELKTMTLNQQPAHISALADEYHRAYDAIGELITALDGPSDKLYNETWTDSKARKTFMELGPARLLVFLNQWQTQVWYNEYALRTLVPAVKTAVDAMGPLWDDYTKAVAAAGDRNNLSNWDTLTHSGIHWYTPPAFAIYDLFNNDDDINKFLVQRIQAVKDDFDQRAANLVRPMQDAYHAAFKTMKGGIGNAFKPPNVLMVPPGMTFDFPGAAPGVPPSISPPAFATTVVPPPVAPPPVPPTIAPPQVNVPTVAPPTVTAPTAPQVNPVPVGLNQPLPLQPPPTLAPPGIAPPVINQGLLPGQVPQVGNLPGNLPNPNAVPNVGGLPNPINNFNGLFPPGAGKSGLKNKGELHSPGAMPGLGGPPGLLPPGGLSRRRREKAGSTLRSPAAYTAIDNLEGVPGQSGLMPPPGAAGRGGRHREKSKGGTTPGLQSLTGPGGMPGGGLLPPPGAHGNRQQQEHSGPHTAFKPYVDANFTQTGLAPPVAPVLGKPNSRKRADAPPATVARGSFAAPTAAPPVLSGRPGAGAALPGGLPMPPGNLTPQQRGKRRGRAGGFAPGDYTSTGMPPMLPTGPGSRQRGDRAGQPNLVGNPDWLVETNPDESTFASPVLHNQATVYTGEAPDAAMLTPGSPGAGAQVLGRQRDAVRRAMEQNRAKARAQREQVEADLARRTVEVDAQGVPIYVEREARQGEEAFTVLPPNTPAQPAPATKAATDPEEQRPATATG